MSSIHFEKLEDYEQMSESAARFIEQAVHQNPALILCAATGSTPTVSYEKLADSSQNFKDVQLLALDEWGNMDPENIASCYHYLNTYLIKPLGIQTSIIFNSSGLDALNKPQEFLINHGPIDLCILGMGQNGHLGFNEPAQFLVPYSHKVELSNESKNHPMISGQETKPTFGFTLGMADILQSRKILLLVNGAHKKKIFQNFMGKKITTNLPASFLWLHPNVTCLTDNEVW